MIKHNYLLILLMLLVSITMFASTADWTILVYMAGDNGLSDAALSDINEMERAVPTGSVNVIVQADFSDIFNEDGNAYRYRIQHDESDEVTSPIISSLGEIDSGDWRTLNSFIDWGFDRYPARHKAVVIWSHGEGWDELDYYKSKYLCTDSESGNKFWVTRGDLKNAFESTPHLDLLILDACNMQTVEVITEVYPFADFVIGSEAIVPTDGMPYDELLNVWNNYSTTEEMVIEIPNIYVDSYLEGGSQNPNNFTLNVTCSVVDSDRFENEFIPNFTDLLERSITHMDDWLWVRNRLMEFNTRAMDVDIRELAYYLNHQVNNQYTADFYDSVSNTFIESSHTLNSTLVGTAILWFPTEESYFHSSYKRYYNLDFEKTTHWGAILNEFFALPLVIGDVLPLATPELEIKTTTTHLKLEWDEVPYPDPIHYEITITTDRGTVIHQTEDTYWSGRVALIGDVEIKAICPFRSLESSVDKSQFTLKGLFVAPNPVKNQSTAFVRCVIPEGIENATFTLYDIAGNRIFNKHIMIGVPGENRFPFSTFTNANLSTGVYFLILSYNGDNQRFKLVITK